MKKLLLAILTIGFFNTNASAQAFSIQETDTVEVDVTNSSMIYLHNMLTTTQTTDHFYTWEVITNTFPAAWLNTNFGICDGSLCYPLNGLDDGPLTDTLRANKPVDLKVQVEPAVTNGTYYITIRLKDLANTFTEDVTYRVNKNVTSVNNIGRNDEITVFPNPAKDFLNVKFEDRADVKNIAVYNLIGKIVSIYKVGGTSAKLDLSEVPAGIYFVRLLNANGQIVATRKFTHQ